MADGKLLLEVKNDVKFKKTEGTLRLLKNKLAWIQKGETVPKFECLYSDIKVQRISPDSSSKVQLQIMLHDERSSNFHFASPKGRDYQFKQRDEVKNLLAQLIPAHRNKVNREIEEKTKMLKEKPELYQLYKDLVKGGIITAEEFWENRKMGLGITDNGAKQSTGISSGFLAEIKPDTHGCNELRFNLTADSIEAIFKTYPAVQRKYESSVPHELSEEKFWTDFFRSRHFHRDRYTTTKSSKDLFGECAERDEEQQLRESIKNIGDPTLDLTNTDADIEEGYGQGMHTPLTTSCTPLIRKFNHQSLMVLKSSSKRHLDADENESKKSEIKKAKLQDATEYEDLENQATHIVQNLKILDADKFAPGITKKGNNMDGGEDMLESDAIQSFKFLQKKVTEWQPNLPQVLTHEQACAALSEISPGSKLVSMSLKGGNAHQLSSSVQSEWKQQYLSLAEVLRHFWSCFPIKSAQLEEKVSRMKSCLEKFRDTKIADFKSKLPDSNTNLVDHLHQQIDAALEKYNTWQQRRVAR
ncbi:general transcription factor IIH subunit 1-like [Rhopilema esculentum]|uniref:general transcription factor IIH subunit 1-like n=1 Tax=Rhopilema esculentum TaxID=499914 RepID=UPI0031D236EC